MEKDTDFVRGLDAVMRARGLKPAPLSERAGLGASFVRDLFRSKAKSPKLSTALKLADALGMSVEDIIAAGSSAASPRSVAIAGAVGAGAKVPLFDAYEKGDGPQVEAPPGLSPHGVVAVEIKGGSMEPVYSDGDILFYTRQTETGVPIEALGRRCVCEDEDGFGWVKIVREGRERGLFDLHSFNDASPPMYGVRLRWAAPVRLHWPSDLAVRL